MAGESTTPMLLKVLTRKEREYDSGGLDEAFERALNARPNYPDNYKAFLPDMEPIATSSSNLMVVNSKSGTSGLTAYRVLVPGFIYVQHWAGAWKPDGCLQVLVSNSSAFSTTYELMNTDGSGVDHVNNMFPIRPGMSTYILLRGDVTSVSGCKKSVYFIPAWGWSRDGERVFTDSSLAAVTGVSIGQVLSGRGSNLSGFKRCFE